MRELPCAPAIGLDRGKPQTPPSRGRSESPQQKVEHPACRAARRSRRHLSSMFFPEECCEREDIPDEIQRATEHDRREAERRIEAFTGFAECFPEHHESTRDRGSHNNEDKIPHLVLCRVCLPGPAQADPEKRNERKWCYKKCPRQAEQSPVLHTGSDRPRAQSPRRNRDRGKVRDSDGLIDSWDAKGAHADDNEAKKRDDAEKDVAHTADGIHRDLLIS